MTAAPYGSGEALEEALVYARTGYLVGPVTVRWVVTDGEGKKVPTFHTRWEKDPAGVSRDETTIRAWAAQYPGTGFHMPCGPNGIVVAEGDVKRSRGDGVTALKDGITAWRDAGGPTPSMTVRTPSGGEHWYFPAPAEPIFNSTNTVLPGVDVRGEGGTVFIAGTRVHGHPAGAEAFYFTAKVVPGAALRPLPEAWERRLRAASKASGRSVGQSSAPAPSFATPNQFHDREWIVRQVQAACARADALRRGNFRQDFCGVAATLYTAANAGVITHDEAEEVLVDAVRRVWAAPPDWEDRQWMRDGQRKAAADPWRVRVEIDPRDAPDAPDAPAPWPTPPNAVTSADVSNGCVPDAPGTHPDAPHDGQDSGASAGASDASDAGRERTSWWLEDLSDVLGEEIEQEPPPCVLRRNDGAALLYAGRVNGVLGESESGKSWVAQHAAAQVICDGEDALYLDFEDSRAGVVGRLRQLGVDPKLIGERFGYVAPQDPLSLTGGSAWEDWVEVVQLRPWAIVVVDGFNVAMDLLGLDMDNNREAGRFLTQFLRPMARESGAALLYVDHVPKDPQGRNKGGIGAQAKRAYTDGLCMRAEIDTPFGRGQSGRLRLTVDKDRLGHVRGISEESKNIGMFKLASTDKETGAVTAEIESFSLVGPKEPTRIMESISVFLQGSPEEWFGTNAINDGVPGRRTTVSEALNHLARRGCVERRTGANRKVEYRFAQRFTAFVAEVQGAIADPDADEDEYAGQDDD